MATLAALVGGSAHTQEQPPVAVTTDTVEYCVQLQGLVSAKAPLPPDVKRLFVEGRRMCDHGEVRPGIARLRRAMWLLHHRVAAP